MAADIVLGHGGDDVPPAPALQRAGFFADHIKRARGALLGHDLGQPFRDLVDAFGSRSRVVLDVEIDDQEHLRLGRSGRGSGRRGGGRDGGEDEHDGEKKGTFHDGTS